MNAITLHAIALARGGNWSLLDALEVSTRARVSTGFAGILHAPGAMVMLGYINSDLDSDGWCEMECPECEGNGDVEVLGAAGGMKYLDCPWCDGEGVIDANSPHSNLSTCSPGEVRTWTTLNGEVIEDSDLGRSLAPYWINRADAVRIVGEYVALVASLSDSAKEPARGN